MSKAFTKEQDQEEDEELPELRDSLPAGAKNYITPAGFARLREELRFLTAEERPKVVDVVSWAAGNGDRSENGDYIYGKKRLREIDRRIRYLTKRLENAEVVDRRLQTRLDQVFFGARVTYETAGGERRQVRIIGVDEAPQEEGAVSWISPIARALHKAYEGDRVKLRTPAGVEEVEVIEISYED
jgi:transcription elongation factor GreB